MLACQNKHVVSTPKSRSPMSRVYRPVLAKANLASDGSIDSMARVFQQHRLLMGSGFTYDQASLILQVSQQRKAAAGSASTHAEHNTSSGPALAPVPEASDSTAPSNTAASGPTMSPAFKTLEDRIAFLELELLKQALATSTTSPDLLPAIISSTDSTSSSFNNTAAALNPAAAGAAGLNAAAAAAASRWSADGSLLRQQSAPGYASRGPAVNTGHDLMSVNAQLAAAAERGQLDPEVFTIAEALAVRQGFASLPAQTPGVSPYTLASQQQPAAVPRRPNSVWGRSGHHTARPLSANSWGDALYDPEYGQPLLSPRDLEEEVPYQPSGWAVAGTIVVVYLGVIVTFLAMCVGDVPY